MNHLTCIEPLEARIAPAMILNPTTVTYQDEHGQTAVVRISKPLFTSSSAAAKILLFNDTSGNSINESFAGNGTSEILNEIDLLGVTKAQDMNISVTVIPSVDGVNKVDVGLIAAANFSQFGNTGGVTQNIDLGKIVIQGDLGQIFAGDNFSTPAIRLLDVLSMTNELSANTSTGAHFVAVSDVLGPITNLHVAGDFSGSLSVVGFSFGSIGNLFIGGALNGAAVSTGGATPGVIQFTGHIGKATIGSMVGSSLPGSGSLIGFSSYNTAIGSLHVKGDVTGGSGISSGEIVASVSIGHIVIDGNLKGGTAGSDANGSTAAVNGDSGFIQTTFLNSLAISGKLVGGPLSGSTVDSTHNASFSGAVVVGHAKSIAIGGIEGGSGVHSGFLGSTTTLGKVVISGDVAGGTAGTDAIAASGGNPAVAAVPGYSGAIQAASVTSLTISGKLTGATSGTDATHMANTSGVIEINHIPSLSLGGIQGGAGVNSGSLFTAGTFTQTTFGAITINGDVTGGAGAGSGSISTTGLFGGIQSLHITGSLLGGTGANSGEISSATSLSTLHIDQNVTGGTANNTGEISVGGNLNTAIIGGAFASSNALNSSNLVLGSGYLQAGHIGSLKIVGGISAFANAGTGGGIANSGAIRSGSDITSLEIDGPIAGVSKNPVVISAAKGVNTAKVPATDLAIGSVTVNGNIAYLDLLAGYSATGVTASSPLGTPADSTAQIGTVSVAGNVSASNIVAGAIAGTDGHFGSSDDKPIATGGIAGLHSKIASIIISGTAIGDSGTGTFGFVSEELGSISVHGAAIPLTPGPENDTTPIQIAGNLFALEVKP